MESNLFIRYLGIELHQTKKIMSTFITSTSISGQEVSVRANNKAKTFTIKTNGSTYRTYPFNKVDFEEADYNTANDWINFLNTYSTHLIK